MRTIVDDDQVRIVDGGVIVASHTFTSWPVPTEFACAAVLCDLMQSRRDLTGQRYVELDDAITSGMASNTGTYYRVMKRAKELRGRI